MILKDYIYKFTKFGMVGVSNTLISLLIYYALINLNVHYQIATILGYIISSIWGYILNRLWVFKKGKSRVLSSVIRYYVVYSSALVLNIFLMYLQVDIIGLSKTIAPVLVLIVTVPYNFILSKNWVYKENIEMESGEKNENTAKSS